MADIVWFDGFEHRRVTGVTALPLTNGQALWDFGAYMATAMTSVAGRTGGYAMQVAEDGTNIVNIGKTWAGAIVAAATDAAKQHVASLYFKATDIPSAASVFYLWKTAAGGLVASIRLNSISGYLQWGIVGGTSYTNGSSVCDGEWHRIDVYFQTLASTWTLDLSLDGTAGTQAILNAQPPTDITEVRFGASTASASATFIVDDWVCSATPADYPLGEYKILSLIPEDDGSHNLGSGGLAKSTGGTTDVWDVIEEWPASTSDYLLQANADNSAYLEYTFGDSTESTLAAARGIICGMSAGTATNSASVYFDNSDHSHNYAVFNGDWSITTAGGGFNAKLFQWYGDDVSITNLNGVWGRFGYSGDATPDPYLCAVMIEYAVAVAGGGPTLKSLAATSTVSLALGRAITAQRSFDSSSTFSAGFARTFNAIRSFGSSAAWSVAWSRHLSLFRPLPVVWQAGYGDEYGDQYEGAAVEVLHKLSAFRTLPWTSTFSPLQSRLSTLARSLSVSAAWTAASSRALTLLRSFASSTAWSVSLIGGKLLTKLLAATTTITAAVAHKLTSFRTLPSTSTFAPVESKRSLLGRTLSSAVAWTTSLARRVLAARSFSVTGTWTAAQARLVTFLRALPVTSTFSAAHARLSSLARKLETASTMAVSQTRLATHLLSLAVSEAWSAGSTKLLQLLRSLDVSSTFSLLLDAFKEGGAQFYEKALEASTTLGVALSRAFSAQRILEVSSTFIAAYARLLSYFRDLPSTSTFGAALARALSLGRLLEVLSTLSPVVAVRRFFYRLLDATSAMTSALSTRGLWSRILSVTSTVTAGLERLGTLARSLSSTSTFSPLQSRLSTLARSLSVSAAWTAASSRALTLLRALPAASTFSPGQALAGVYHRLLDAASTMAVSLTRSGTYIRLLDVGATFGPESARQLFIGRVLEVSGSWATGFLAEFIHVVQRLLPFLTSRTGSWTPVNADTLDEAIDEYPYDDWDYIESSEAPESDVCVVQLSSVSDPNVHTDHVIFYRYDKTGSGSVDLTVQLREGYVDEGTPGTLIHEEVELDVAEGVVQAEVTITEEEAATITDYADLFLRFVAEAGA